MKLQLTHGGGTKVLTKNVILILSDNFDEHATVVTSELDSMGADYFRFNLDVNSLKDSNIDFNGAEWRITQAGKSLQGSAVATVWCRKATVTVTSEHEDDKSNGFRIWRSEWNRVLYGFYSSLRFLVWLNPLQKSALADNKYYQLAIASEIGLIVPPFVSSNSLDNLKAFFIQHGDCAFKMMSQDLYRSSDGTARGLYVNRLSVAELADFSNSGENPITLQKYIEKNYEVRYTIVDKSHFVCKIESQASERTAIDWRRYDIPKTPHLSITPPTQIREKISALVERLGLNFGAIDFIVDQNDKWWFLEVNSNGQWL